MPMIQSNGAKLNAQIEGPERAPVLRSAVNQFILAVILDLKFDFLHNGQGGDGHQRDHQKQHEQDIALLAGFLPASGGMGSGAARIQVHG